MDTLEDVALDPVWLDVVASVIVAPAVDEVEAEDVEDVDAGASVVEADADSDEEDVEAAGASVTDAVVLWFTASACVLSSGVGASTPPESGMRPV